MGRCFRQNKKKRRERRRASKRGWSYPITFRSLVVRSTARTQNVDIFLKFFEVVWDHPGCIQGVVRGRWEQLSSNIFPDIYFVNIYFIHAAIYVFRHVHVFDIMFKFVGIIWDVSRRSLEVLWSNFRRAYFSYVYFLKKCLGGSRMVLGVPRTLLQIMNFLENLYFVNRFL